MVMSPEAAVSPVAQAPPDRPTVKLEQALRQVIGIIFGDRRLDDDEKQLLRGFMEEIALRGQNGGIGQGGTPPAELGATNMPPSPMEMNGNVEDMGTVEGATQQEEY